MSGFPKHVRVVEVGPRDGLQNESKPVSIANRIQLINMLTDAGLASIEVGSFVMPSRVPQMAGSEDVVAGIIRKNNIRYIALVPNIKGFERAVAAGVTEIAVFAAASETFSQRNINCSIEESLQRFIPIITAAQEHGIAVRGYVSCIVGCPYEGEIDAKKVAQLTKQLLSMGCYEVSLGDTIGCGTPNQISAVLKEVLNDVPADQLAVHFHDTNGRALDNIRAALAKGISVVDSSIGGLGGCPYAEGATGNVSTESVVGLLNELGITCGISEPKLLEASSFIRKELS